MDKSYYQQYFVQERSHWWFKARAHLLTQQIAKNIALPESNSCNILNAGVATGATSDMLNIFGKVTSLEYDEDCCNFLRNSLGMEVTQGSLTELPYPDNTFDLVCSFDVIEHIKEHDLAVSEIRRVLKPGGYYFLTVPAFEWLWSKHDEVNHHERRYTLPQLTSLIKSEGLEVAFSSYFNFLLSPPIFLLRMGNIFNGKRKRQSNHENKQENDAKSDFDTYSFTNFLSPFLYHIFKSEKYILNRKIKLPFGVSLMAFGKKTS